MALETSVKMQQHFLIVCFVLLVCSLQFVSSVEDTQDSVNPGSSNTDSGPKANADKDPGSPADTGNQVVPPQKPHVTGVENCTDSDGNSTTCDKDNSGYFKKLSDLYEKGTIKRAFYVLIGITGIVVIYFIVRTVKSRRRSSKSKKYGVISMPGNDLEMAPLDADDEEDDVTVFEVNGHK